jgi:uncharacterized membrane protein
MTLLILGLAIFLGVHSLHLLAPGWRVARIRQLGVLPWRGLYALVALTGFVLLVWSYGLARHDSPHLLWLPPAGLRHAAAALTLPAFVLLIAAYVPGNHFKAWLGHPMLAGTKLWALAHLLASGWLHGVVVFGAFLIWAVIAFAVAHRRDRVAGLMRAPGRWPATLLAIVIGAATWWLFAFHLHARLIGVAPYG